MNFKNYITNIVDGFPIEKGKSILLQFWGENCDLDILNQFSLDIGKKGGIPIGVQYSREFLKDYFTNSAQEALSFPQECIDLLKSFYMVVDIFMYSPRPHEDFPTNKMSEYKKFMQNIFGSISGAKYYLQLRVPTEELAQEEGIEFKIFNEAICNGLDVNMKELKIRGENLIDSMKDKTKVKITTKGNRVLNLDLQGRKWINDSGDGDIPAGEVYIAPVEKAGNGEILIDKIHLEGKQYTDVICRFEEGILVESSCNQLMDFVKRFPNGDKLSELGIGTNPKVTDCIGYSALDEKALGTAHIALGMNAMFGGNIESPLHFDMIFKPQKLEVDDIDITKFMDDIY